MKFNLSRIGEPWTPYSVVRRFPWEHAEDKVPTMQGKALIQRPNSAALRRAAETLREGGLIAFPTETVYGLGGDAASDKAVASIFAAKRRPRFNPLIVHVLDARAAAELTLWDGRAEDLARAFWPGPLTLVLRAAPLCPVSLLARAGLDTIAVRAPAHPVARALLATFGAPIAAPSANRSGRVSPTEAFHVADEFGGEAAMILDGGRCAIGLESTIVDLSGHTPRLLRPGGVPGAALAESLGFVPSIPTDVSTQRPTSPGQLESHYAPSLSVRLGARSVALDEALLAFGRDVPPGACETLNLSETGDLTEAAAHLFAYLRRLDRPAENREGRRAIAVMEIPNHGLGEAINDRLERAAAPRSWP